jgi:hypothetical protein
MRGSVGPLRLSKGEDLDSTSNWKLEMEDTKILTLVRRGGQGWGTRPPPVPEVRATCPLRRSCVRIRRKI